MLIEKILETKIDILEVNDIYTTDIKGYIKQQLIKKYAGICYSSMLIIEIVEILRHSMIRMTYDRLDASASLDVQFKVKGIVITTGDILHDCIVTHIDNIGIFIKNDYIEGYIKDDSKKPFKNFIQVKKSIPVTVIHSRYNIYKPSIAIMCSPYYPKPIDIKYYNIEINEQESDKLSQLLEQYLESTNEHEKNIKKPQYKFFKNILYPYKSQIKIPSKGYKEIENIKKITDMNPTDKSLTNKFYVMFDPSDSIYETDIHNPNELYIKATLYGMLSEMLSCKMRYYKIIEDFINTYDTTEKTKELNMYWQLCNEYKSKAPEL